MLSILAIVLGLVIIVSAIAADRSARARHPFRAIALNLCGIGCLAIGLLSVFAWSHQGIHRSHQVATASPDGETAVVVQLVIGSDGQLEHPVATESNAALAEAEPATQAEAELDEPLEDDAAALLERIELEGLDELENDEPPRKLDPEMAHVEIDYDARPEWVDQPDRDLGAVHQISVTAGPYTKLRQARRELFNELETKTDEYIREFVGHPHAAHWVGYDAGEIRHRFVAPDRIFDEKVRSPSFGDMHQSHALLEFGPAFHKEVEQAWHQIMARAQLVKVALAGGAIMGMLVLLFGYFNADSATRGFYSGRLKFVTVLAILAVIATGVLIARSIPWLWL